MDQAQGMSQGQDTSASVSTPVTSSQTSPSAPAPQTSHEERTFRQSEVTDLVRRAKSDALDSYKRMQTEQPQYLDQKLGDSRPQNQLAPSQNQSSMNEQQIRQMAAEEAKRHMEGVRQEAYQKSQDEMAQRTINNFRSKVQAGKEKYSDFDKVVPGNDILVNYPNVVHLLGDFVDNSADILYHIKDDLTKMELIESMANRSPQAAIAHMQKLSQSLKDNEAASKVRLPNEPLSQMRPSNTGTDNGAMSVKDYRKKYRV